MRTLALEILSIVAMKLYVEIGRPTVLATLVNASSDKYPTGNQGKTNHKGIVVK